MPPSQNELVRQRFTRTAAQFASFSLTSRREEAEELARLVLPHVKNAPQALALDVACGPGTFTWAFAQRLRFAHGLDITPALLQQALNASREAGFTNVSFCCGDAAALPFAAASLDLALTAYSLHHIAEPETAVNEMARVVRAGGVVAVMDLVVPPGADAEFCNRIERARDRSHTRTLTRDELLDRLASAGLRVVANQPSQRLRSFGEWMHIAGWGLNDPAYVQTRRLMEADCEENLSGFRPRRQPTAEATHADLEFTQTSLAVVAVR